MLPSQLSASQFAAYPSEARQLAVGHLRVLQRLPVAFAPLLLREVMSYDWKFPAERKELDQQFAYLSSLAAAELDKEVQGFTQLRLRPELERFDWVSKPGEFSEQLTAHLWATHQMDTFRAISVEYVHKLNAAKAEETPAVRRLVIVIVGQGVSASGLPLFRKLRPHGVRFKNVEPENGCAILLGELAGRASKYRERFAHWYIDGGQADGLQGEAPTTTVSYLSLEPVRLALVDKMRKVMQPGGGGPEALRTLLAQMSPQELGLSGAGDAAVLNRFRISVLTEGSGTQLFSTTFVQWSAREALRRAQPLTLLARYAPRQREESMNELLAGIQHKAQPDPEGSLVDADMGAYYTWINLQRLPGAEQSSFLVWFEGHGEALAIAPSLKRGTEDEKRISMHELLARLV